jgi:hypothetical protein
MSAAALACYSAKIINRSAVMKCKDTSLFWWYFSKELYDLKKDGLSDIMESPSGGGSQIVETEDLFSRYVSPDQDDEELIRDDTGATAFAVCVESFIAHGFSRGAINFFSLMSMKTGNLKDKMGILRKQYNCKNHQTIFDSIKEEIADGVARGLQFFKVECFESGSTVFFVCAGSQDEAEETMRGSRGLTVMRSEPLCMGIE